MRDMAVLRAHQQHVLQRRSNTHNIQQQPLTSLISSNYWAPLQQLDELQQTDGVTAVLAAPQAGGDLAADGKHMKPANLYIL